MALLPMALFAQPHIEVNLQNMHLWRGGEVADGVVITSDLGYSLMDGNLRVGFWGGTNVVGSYKEFNYYASYRVEGLSFTLVDTYNFSDGASYNNREFFNYNPSQTGRFLDATLKYYFGDDFPLTLSWSTVLFGRDRNIENTENLYSTFCNVEYRIYQRDRWQVDGSVGAAFALNDDGVSPNFFGTGPGIVQVMLRAQRKVSIGEYTVPIFIAGMVNPQASKGYLQLGATFRIE